MRARFGGFGKLMAGGAILAFAACSATTTGGGQVGYTKQDLVADIQRYDASTAADAETQGDGRLDAEVDALFKLAPQIRFPARIALAKLSGGTIQRPTDEDIAIFTEVARKLGPDFGEFVILDPVMAQMAAETVGAQSRSPRADLRRGAALIKADYALVYSIDSQARASENALSVTDWTIIGLWISPSRNVEAQAVAQAAMLDIRTGLPLGSASAEADASTIARFTTETSRKRETRNIAADAAIAALAADVEALGRQLMADAKAQQAQQAEGAAPARNDAAALQD